MKYQNRIKFVCLILFVSTFIACTTPGFKSHSDIAPDADISAYKTFSWISDTPLIQQAGAVIISPLNSQRIQTSIESKLVEMGYEYVSLSKLPDFTVSFTVGTRDKTNLASYPNYYQRDSWRWPYHYHNEVYVHQYTEGTLAIDIFDFRSGKPVWHGVASKKILSTDRKEPQDAINKAVIAILEQLPSKN